MQIEKIQAILNGQIKAVFKRCQRSSSYEEHVRYEVFYLQEDKLRKLETKWYMLSRSLGDPYEPGSRSESFDGHGWAFKEGLQLLNEAGIQATKDNVL